jgi:hypothetical protein
MYKVWDCPLELAQNELTEHAVILNMYDHHQHQQSKNFRNIDFLVKEIPTNTFTDLV